MNGIYEHQPNDFIRIGAGEQMDIQSSEGLPYQDIWRGDLRFHQQLVKLCDHMFTSARLWAWLAHPQTETIIKTYSCKFCNFRKDLILCPRIHSQPGFQQNDR